MLDKKYPIKSIHCVRLQEYIAALIFRICVWIYGFQKL